MRLWDRIRGWLGREKPKTRLRKKRHYRVLGEDYWVIEEIELDNKFRRLRR